MEHLQAAANPTSNMENSIAQHYSSVHRGVKPSLNFEVLDIQSITVRRKIVEAFYILRENPSINDKNELTYLCKYLVD